jgi:hypothetical protein
MTDRIRLDDLTSDQYDALHERLRKAERAANLLADSHRRADRLTTEITALRDDLRGITGARYIADALDAILDGSEPAAGPAATEATDPHTGLVIEPYRNDRGESAWVFRCWGTDRCDGYLSLDHYSEQSAERARDRHVTEEHTEEQP